LLADPAAGPRALDLLEVHVVLVGEPPDQRRDDPPLRGVALLGGLGSLRSCRLGLGLLLRGRLLFLFFVLRLGFGGGLFLFLFFFLFLLRLLGLRLGLGLGLGLGLAAFDVSLAHHCECGSDLHGLAFGHEDLLDLPGRGRGDFRIHLVGRDLNEELVLLDGVALLLQPFSDRSLDDGLAELRHLDLSRHAADPPLREPPGRRNLAL
jgi:hypothetical protein